MTETVWLAQLSNHSWIGQQKLKFPIFRFQAIQENLWQHHYTVLQGVWVTNFVYERNRGIGFGKPGISMP